MGLITQHSASGYRCDKTRCTNTFEGEPMPIYLAEEHYEAQAKAAGWTFVRHRRLWVYCADHRPCGVASVASADTTAGDPNV